MPPKKILIVIDAFTKGGAQNVLKIIINEWLKTSIEVEIVFIQNSKSELNLNELKASGLRIHRLNAFSTIDLIKFLEFRKIVENFKPDQIHAHLYWSQIWCGLLKKKDKRRRIVWIEHNTYINRTSIKWILYKLLSKRVNQIIAVSSEVKEFLNGKVLSPVKVIVNPVKTHRTRTVRNFNKPSFMFVGRLNNQKNPLLAIQSFNYALINKFIPENSMLYIAGEGPLKNELENYIDLNDLAKSVKILGFLNSETLSIYYSKSIALVSTSKFEGFSLVRVEALSKGCNVITTRTSGILGILTKSENYQDLILGVIIVQNDLINIALAFKESLKRKYWNTFAISERQNIFKKHNPVLISKKYLIN